MAIWKSRKVTVKFLPAGTAVERADFSAITKDYSSLFKSISFKEPETDVKQEKTLGEDANGIPNSEHYSDDATDGEVSGEMFTSPHVADDLDIADEFYTYTSNKMNYADEAVVPSMLIDFGDGTNGVAFILGKVRKKTLGGFEVDPENPSKGTLELMCDAGLCIKEKYGTFATP